MCVYINTFWARSPRCTWFKPEPQLNLQVQVQERITLNQTTDSLLSDHSWTPFLSSSILSNQFWAVLQFATLVQHCPPKLKQFSLSSLKVFKKAVHLKGTKPWQCRERRWWGEFELNLIHLETEQWISVVNCMGNPRVFLAVPIPVPVVGFTHEPVGFLVKTGPRSSKTVKY